MDVVLQHQQAGRQAGQRAAQRRGDEVDLLRVDAHQRHDLAVLRDRADGGAGVGARHEEVDHHHADQRRAEGEQPRVAEMHVGKSQHRQADAEIAEVDAEGHGGEALQHEQHAAGGQQLVDRRRREQRRDHQVVQQGAQDRHQHDRERCGEVVRQAVVLDEEVHAVHADHHQLGVADPRHVDDAEDQVQAERQQGQQPAQQDAVHHRLEEVDVEDFEERLHHSLLIGSAGLRPAFMSGPEARAPSMTYTPRYACLTRSLASISCALPVARMVPASRR